MLRRESAATMQKSLPAIAKQVPPLFWYGENRHSFGCSTCLVHTDNTPLSAGSTDTHIAVAPTNKSIQALLKVVSSRLRSHVHNAIET